MEKDQIDKILFSSIKNENPIDKEVQYLLEQYRIYIHVLNDLCERRLKSNEFFLGVNTAIMGIIGYLESKEIPHTPVIFILVPFVGIAICFVWYKIIHSYSQLTKAKFSIIHRLEQKLPTSLFQTEWEVLGRGNDKSKYNPLSHMEVKIPIIFLVLYFMLFMANLPWDILF